jgi:hypothetical protein
MAEVHDTPLSCPSTALELVELVIDQVDPFHHSASGSSEPLVIT